MAIAAVDFEKEHTFDVMASTALRGKAPDGFDWGRYYRTFGRVTATPRQLAVHIWQGFAFTPVWHTARREANFVSAGHMAFDFDAGDTSSSLDHLMRVGSFAWMFASFAYATPSSTPAAPRSRVVFVLEFPIFDPAEYRAAYGAVAWWLGQEGSYTDPACKDPLRLYYGSPECQMRPNWSVLGAATLRYVEGEYKAAHPPTAPRSLRVIDTSPGEGLIAWKRRRIVEAIRSAPKGERHRTLLRRAREAGGYVASGVFNEGEIAAELAAAAGDLGEGENGRKEVEQVVRDGLRYGKAAPLYFERAESLRELLK